MMRPTEFWNRRFNEWTWPMVVLVVLVVIVLGGVVLALIFTGCAAQPGGQETYGSGGPVRQGSSGDFTEHTITLSDGRTVTCLTWASWDFINEAMKSGMDCLEAKPE